MVTSADDWNTSLHSLDVPAREQAMGGDNGKKAPSTRGEGGRPTDLGGPFNRGLTLGVDRAR
jgi:hypothetical protein